jgi:hypothetical protein
MFLIGIKPLRVFPGNKKAKYVNENKFSKENQSEKLIETSMKKEREKENRKRFFFQAKIFLCSNGKVGTLE